MTVLVAGGDSFTYGEELKDCKDSPSNYTWSALLAKKLGMSYCCTASSGSSNGAIRRRVINAIDKYKNEDLFVAVMWSFPNRYEFRFTYDTGHRDSPWYSFNPWIYQDVDMSPHFVNQDNDILNQNLRHRENADKRGMNDFARSYISHVAGNEYWELYTSWSEIVMLQNYLIKNKIDYIFAHVDDSLFECNSPMDASLKALRSDIDKSKWVLEEGMYNWAKRTKQDFYTTHPAESAHTDFINKLFYGFAEQKLK